MNQTEVIIKLSIPSITTAEVTEKPVDSGIKAGGSCTLILQLLNLFIGNNTLCLM
ncbi:817_t:CDS:2 [Rhizophagus irregularis]|nr:817_t:CDS:2 [Rhizophagus irregularis]